MLGIETKSPHHTVMLNDRKIPTQRNKVFSSKICNAVHNSDPSCWKYQCSHTYFFFFKEIKERTEINGRSSNLGGLRVGLCTLVDTPEQHICMQTRLCLLHNFIVYPTGTWQGDIKKKIHHHLNTKWSWHFKFWSIHFLFFKVYSHLSLTGLLLGDIITSNAPWFRTRRTLLVKGTWVSCSLLQTVKKGL